MIKKLLLLVLVLISTGVLAQENEKQVLLIGTFHFHNPGHDVAKTESFDVLKPETQDELESIAETIKEFGPDKIFVEWNYAKSKELDSIYNIYSVKEFSKDTSKTDFYRKNEIFQLAFRAAKKMGHSGVYPMDYNQTIFPYDSLMKTIEKNQQVALKSEIDKKIQTYEDEFNNQIKSGWSLKEILLAANTNQSRKDNISFYTDLSTRVGEVDEFVGAYLTAEWYRRNIYMWSVIQKITEESDDKIMILAGSGHAAIFDQLLSYTSGWNIVELKEILN